MEENLQLAMSLSVKNIKSAIGWQQNVMCGNIFTCHIGKGFVGFKILTKRITTKTIVYSLSACSVTHKQS